jgi:hypothetical protein
MNDHNKNRHDDGKQQEEFELTAAEKKALKKLPRDRISNRAQEDRLVAVLRERGLLKPPRRRVIELTAWRIAAVAAACVVLLTTGFVLGQWTGSRRIASDDHILQDDFSAAASLQQAGSAYLLALGRLVAVPDSVDGQQATQGREVALSTLCTAADRVTRLVPKNVLAGQLLAALDTDSEDGAIGGHGEVTIEGSRVIEF